MTQIKRTVQPITQDEFMESIFEQAFGDNAISKDYSYEDVLQKIKEQTSELETFLTFIQTNTSFDGDWDYYERVSEDGRNFLEREI